MVLIKGNGLGLTNAEARVSAKVAARLLRSALIESGPFLFLVNQKKIQIKRGGEVPFSISIEGSEEEMLSLLALIEAAKLSTK